MCAKSTIYHLSHIGHIKRICAIAFVYPPVNRSSDLTLIHTHTHARVFLIQSVRIFQATA